jgi:NDP-sugar pyrophosphorylase family protein
MTLAAVVLAAGAGTRLRPLTELRPKALCPVANVPLLDLALERVARVADRIAVNASYLHEQVEEHLRDRDVHLSVELPGPLGTAGAIGRLREWLDGDDVLVVNADAWQEFELGFLCDGWNGRRIRLAVVPDPARGDFGDWRFAGASLLPNAEAMRLEPVPRGLYEVCWRPALDAGRVDLCPAPGRFIDCGTPADYLAANLAASGGVSVVGPGAVVLGEVERSVVWADARVEPGERLVEVIRAGGLTVPAGG